MKLVSVLSLGVAVWTLSAGAAGGQVLSLEDAVAAARENNSKLGAARDMADAAAADVRFSRGALLPELAASGTYSRLSGDVLYARFLPGIPGQPPGGATDIGSFDTTQAANLILTQPLYAGGGNGAKLQASRVEQALAEQDVSQVEHELVFEVTQAYLQVLLADKSLAVTRDSVQRTEQNLASVRQLQAEREALDVDVLAAQTQLASDQHGLMEAENDRKFAALAFNRLLGRDQDARVELADILSQTADLAEEQEALAQAQASNPEIRKAGLRIELADAGIKGARSHSRPKLSINGLFTWLDNETFFEGNFWGGALNVSIPFARGMREGAGALAGAKARRSAAESSLEETTSLVLLATRRALSEAREADRAVEVAEQNRRYHQEKYRVTSSKFAESLSTVDDLLDDHVELGEAERALYRAQYRARLAEAEVRRLVAPR